MMKLINLPKSNEELCY